MAQRYPLNTRVHGKVSSVADFGVFVEIEEGIEGLIHISQLSNERVDKPSSLYKVDDELEALVVQVDPKRAPHRALDQGASSSTKSARRCRPISSASTRRRASRWKISSTKNSGSIATTASGARRARQRRS